MREKVIQAKVVSYARAKGCLARKLDFGQGWPDYLFIHKGKVLFIEFKGAGGRLMPLQGHVHSLLRGHGFPVEMCNDSASGTMLIDHFLRGAQLSNLW